MNFDLLLEKREDGSIINRYTLFDEKETIEFLPSIKNINMFVGANNSGKSWMMRYLMNLSNYNCAHWKEIKTQILNFNTIVEKGIELQQRSDMRSYNFTAPNISIKRFNTLDLQNISENIEKNKQNFIKLDKFPIGNWYHFDNHIDLDKVNSLISLNDEIHNLISKNVITENPIRYYVPTLRSAHSLYTFSDEKHVKIEDDIFDITLKRNFPTENVKTFTGLHLYKSILNSRNARKEIRNRFEDFETFVQNNFFSGKKIDIVAYFDKDKSLEGDNSEEVIYIHIEGENDTRKLHELGDGIQAIIILMYQIFMAEENSIIFIDEPELNLHPGMQRLFFEQISFNKDITKKKLTYFISTHSNHLLDLTLESDDVSIYSFTPIVENGDKKIIVKNINFGNAELLRDLGVNNTSVFLANASIWVEGISDRNYIKAFLRAYCDAEEGRVYPKEDIDFTFFEYAGGNIEHYILGEDLNGDEEERFVEEINALALSNKIFLLADSDMAKEGTKKYLRLKSFEEKFSRDKNFDGLILWEIRESENLLPVEVWQKVLIEFCNKNSVNESTQYNINQFFIENQNLNRTEYVGKFLKRIKESGIPLNDVCKKQIRGSGEEWQTFKDKANLSRILLEKTLNKEITWDDFKQVPEIVTLTKKIYNFIFKQEK